MPQNVVRLALRSDRLSAPQSFLTRIPRQSFVTAEHLFAPVQRMFSKVS
jgi:hypothetical protein